MTRNLLRSSPFVSIVNTNGNERYDLNLNVTVNIEFELEYSSAGIFRLLLTPLK